MDHGLELIILILEILEIEASDILQNPGNTGKRIFQLSQILDILENIIFYLLISWKYWKTYFSNFSYPGNIGSYDP